MKKHKSRVAESSDNLYEVEQKPQPSERRCSDSISVGCPASSAEYVQQELVQSFARLAEKRDAMLTRLPAPASQP